MKNSEKDEIQKGVSHFASGSVCFFKAFIIRTLLTLWEIIKNLKNELKDAFKKRDYSGICGVIGAFCIVLLITIYSFFNVYITVNDYFNRENYKREFIQGAEKDALEFFKLYTKKFIEKDCDFMAKVAVDEAMYIKSGTTKKENYYCDNFYNPIKAKYFLPYEIDEKIYTPDRQSIKGKTIVLREMTNGTLMVSAQYFEIWKYKHLDLWRLNVLGNKEDLRIPIKTTEGY